MAEQTIKLLPDDLINKIAAGEVVERPAAVVKELLENSLDAGAGRIVIEIKEAGKKLISVADDGRGLSEQEILLALQRHSTSKISSAEDLFKIKTLGFRGEALPSIASISRLEIVRNPGGKGVTVRVEDLFYNTPARKKFLKANSTELGHISDLVSRYALAYPQVAFSLSSDGKPLLSTNGSGNLKEVLLSIYGRETAAALVEFSGGFSGGRIFGALSLPTISRLNREQETFFVNGRYVRHFLLNRALEEAYRGLIPGGRYPAAVVFVEIDPAKVDVNVHPTKREVKFADNHGVMTALTALARQTLSGGQKEALSGRSFYQGGVPESSVLAGAQEAFFGSGEFTPPSLPGNFEVSTVQPLFPLYQFQATYIAATDGEELVIIDQHAAHERIVYDRLSARAEASPSQNLLVPVTLEFSSAEGGVVRENLAYFSQLGFQLEEFGGETFILRTLPAFLSEADPGELVRDVAAGLGELAPATVAENRSEELRKLIACHSAIRAGQKLDRAEMDNLIKELYQTANPLTCPHGRPTMIRLSNAELAKRFGR